MALVGNPIAISDEPDFQFSHQTASKNLCKSFLEEQDVTEAQVHGVTSSR